MNGFGNTLRAPRRTFASRPRLIWLAPLLGALSLAGCDYDDDCDDYIVTSSAHPTAFGTDTEFTWTGALFGYSATDEYIWTTVWDEVFVEFVGIDFFGEVRVQVFDDLFTPVFDQTYFGSGGFIEIDSISELGFAGDWTILITSFNVSGQVTLRLD